MKGGTFMALRILAWAVFTGLLASLPARGAEKALSRTQQKKFVSKAIKFLALKYQPDSEEKRKAILEELKAFEGFSWKGLRKAFRPPTAKPFLRPPKKKHGRTLQFPPSGLESCTYIVKTPRGYSPGKAWPLAVLLHGGGKGQGHGSQIMGLLGPPFQKRGCIVIAPTIPPESYWCGPNGERFVMAILRETIATYSVDPDRIYVAGHSFGGVGAWSFGTRFPDFFAGFGPAAGNPPNVMDYDLFHNTPFYVCHGEDDPRVTAKPDLEARDKVEALDPKPRAYVFDFGAFGHGFPHASIEAMATFLTKHKRDMFVKRAVCVSPFAQVTEGIRSQYHTFWLGIDEHLTGAKAVGELVGKNRIRVTSPVASRISIYVSDDFLDLSKPIQVELNGFVVFEKKVTRSAEFLVKHMEATGDRGRVFANKIQLD
jgi:pimeloyl-ACP methyl ester carboxylesterase